MTKENTLWHYRLSDEQRDLYDIIESSSLEFTGIGTDKCQKFMDKLHMLGITAAKEFENCHSFGADSVEEFAEYWCTEVCCRENEPGGDWRSVWVNEYSHEFKTIEFNDSIYFFHAHKTYA